MKMRYAASIVLASAVALAWTASGFRLQASGEAQKAESPRATGFFRRTLRGRESGKRLWPRRAAMPRAGEGLERIGSESPLGQLT